MDLVQDSHLNPKVTFILDAGALLLIYSVRKVTTESKNFPYLFRCILTVTMAVKNFYSTGINFWNLVNALVPIFHNVSKDNMLVDMPGIILFPVPCLLFSIIHIILKSQLGL